MDALQEGAWVYSHLEHYSRQQRFDAAASLAEWGVFSLRQIGAIVGLSHTTVRRIAKHKPDRTGGTFSPECLEPLLEIRKRYRRGEPVTTAEIRRMLHAGTGTSIYFAARLSGIREGWLRRNSKERSTHDERGTDTAADLPVAAEH